jgi:hypothetical protein
LARISEVRMGYVKSWTTALSVSFIAACSPPTPPPPPPPPPPATSVFDPLTQQVERARGVQKTVDEQADRTRKAIDAEERGDSSQ